MYADMLDTIGFVAESDPQVARAMQGELCRQRQNIELIASENVVSPAVLAAMGAGLLALRRRALGKEAAHA